MVCVKKASTICQRNCCWLQCALSGGFSQEARIPGNDQADTWGALGLISAYWLKQLLTITWNRCNLQRAGLRITWNLCNPQLGLEPNLASAGSVGPTQYLVDSPKARERTENNSELILAHFKNCPEKHHKTSPFVFVFEQHKMTILYGLCQGRTLRGVPSCRV